MKKPIPFQLLSLILVLNCLPLLADVALPKAIGSNMVLQRRQSVPVWGWAESGEWVTVEPFPQNSGHRFVGLREPVTCTQLLDTRE